MTTHFFRLLCVSRNKSLRSKLQYEIDHLFSKIDRVVISTFFPFDRHLSKVQCFERVGDKIHHHHHFVLMPKAALCRSSMSRGIFILLPCM